MDIVTICVLILGSIAFANGDLHHHHTTGASHSQWMASDTVLRFLTNEMSDMEQFKSTILNPFLIERVSDTPGNKQVQLHILSKLTNWHTELDSFNATTPYGVKEFTNIIATFDPTKPVKVVLACHFDSKFMSNAKFVGAIDSAVPCSILLETVKQLQCLLEKGPQAGSSAEDVTLQLIFFDGEEAFRQWTNSDSLYGSRHLANKMSLERDPVNSNITKIQAIREFYLLDLLGTSDTVIPQQFARTAALYQGLYQTEHNLRSHNYLTGNHSGPIFNGQISWGGVDDDHVPFEQRGVPIVHLISYPFPSVWHMATDDFQHLDFYFIDDFSRIFRVFVSKFLDLQAENRSCRKK